MNLVRRVPRLNARSKPRSRGDEPDEGVFMMEKINKTPLTRG